VFERLRTEPLTVFLHHFDHPRHYVMDMASMLLLFDHSLTVTFQDVPQFSAAIDFGMSLDSSDIFFSGEFMFRLADTGTDSGFLRLLTLLEIENLLTMSRRAREVTWSVHMVVAMEVNTGNIDASCAEKIRVSCDLLETEPSILCNIFERFVLSNYSGHTLLSENLRHF